MAIVWCREQWKGRSTVRDDKGTREYMRTFQVLTDSVYTSQLLVREATAFGLPAMFAGYISADGSEFDTYALVSRISARQDEENGFLWNVEVQYSTQANDPDRVIDPVTGQPIDDPLLEPQEIEWSFQQFQKPLERDLDNIAIASSAGGKFDPAIVVDDSRLVVRITKNEPTFIVAVAILYQDAVNDDWFFGSAPGTAKIASLRGVKQSKYGRVYYQNTYEIHFRREGWQLKVLDRDYSHVQNQSARNRQRAVDAQGRPSGDPILLNGYGMPLDYLNVEQPGAVAKLTSAIGLTDTMLTIAFTGAQELTRFPINTTGSILTPSIDFNIEIGIPPNREIMRVKTAFAGPPVQFEVDRFVGGQRNSFAADSVVRMAPYFIPFQGYKELPFAPLGLIPY